MAVSIHNLIAAINPDVYCDSEVKGEVKEIAKKDGYLKAAEKAKPRDSEFMDLAQELFISSPFKLTGIKNPIEKHKLEYDNFAGQNLEQIYFWILDYINREYDNSEKLVDNFASAVGSAHFGEIGQRLTIMQQNAQRNFELANTVVKSIMNLIYSLKDFKLRLSDYEKYHSKEETEKKASLLSLKERWLDLVDARRGQSSIRSLTIQFDFATLLSAFMAAESLNDVKKMDLNEIVKNVLLQRLSEFFKWIEQSENQLRTRYELEKKYLKTQVDSLRLYSRWAKPYLKAAKQLEQRATQGPALVTLFETTLLELVLLGEGRYNIEVDISNDNIPKLFRKFTKKNYKYIVIVELKFRANPQKTQYGGSFSFRGRTEIEFTSYALSQKEIEILKHEMEKDDMGDLVDLIEGATQSLETMKPDIEEFLEEKQNKKQSKKEKSEDINPFSTLFSIFKTEKKESSEDSKLLKDTAEEKVIRSQAIIKARLECRKFYNTFKDTYNMPSFF